MEKGLEGPVSSNLWFLLPLQTGPGYPFAMKIPDDSSVPVCCTLSSCSLQRTTTVPTKSHVGTQDQELTCFSHAEESF